ncbi:glycosyltransferase involved in cell wall biosynthesis [Pseudarthrobacter sp. PvP004]|uniref:glycosyltransferase family 4 protein n=1 Tax=Pseudarthrobacter sp. PvP004 TaxID=2817850 RepID=UPI001AE26519|nr:glycosyltransferase family 4 protein [Pseudarthrobacter sp. PvP004]MBP2268323.1 glycosyltransferase involved in cell wall biosynthesis [Pseudarthrobacter sp. PvP004]
MKALIVGLNYAPEPSGNAPYTSKLSQGLAGRGVVVKVLTGYPHYPEWKIADGYKGFSMEESLGGVPVKRLRSTVPRRPNGLGRFIMEITFGVRAMLERWERPDVVLVVSPALFSAAFTILRARIFGIPVGIWVQDLYSKGIEETGHARSPLASVMKRMESAILSAADGVSVIHERFRDHVVNDLGVPAHRVRVIRNWTHVQHHHSFDRSAARKRLGWAPTDFVALHAGNMGVKQGLENLIDTAHLAGRSGSDVRVVLLGNGNQRRILESKGAGIDRLQFLEPLPDRDYSEALRSADVLLVNERPGVREMSVPSKLTSYFVTGLPIIAATEEDSATAHELSAAGAGIRADSGSPVDLVAAIERLREDPDSAKDFGVAGQQYSERVLTEEVAVESYLDWLGGLASRKQSR